MKSYPFMVLFMAMLLLVSCNTPPPATEPEITIPETSREPEKVQFLTQDSLLVTANLYDRGSDFPVIVLCHQARFNKIEYAEIAKTLYDEGFNSLALDQRSGGHIVESFNETFLEANKKELPVEYLDAEPDIIAGIEYAVNKYNKQVILWGSSYSATLSLHLACENENIGAVIAFSPGNYFDEQKGSLNEKLKELEMPMFVTSSQEEAPDITTLLEGCIGRDNQIQFIPTSAGKHGSRALWKTHEDNAEYWTAILKFLKGIDATDVNHP